MKFGFGKKKGKKHNNKKTKKAKKKGDAAMKDVDVNAATAEEDMALAEPLLSAKEKQKQRMELKTSLRVKVNKMKVVRYGP